MKTTLHSQDVSLAIEYTQHGDDVAAVIDGHTLHARLLSAREGTFILLIDGRPVSAHVARDSQRTLVAIEGQVYSFTHAQEKQSRARASEAGRLDPTVRSPMPGKILQVLVTEGAEIEAGQTLILLEAMKMENSLTTEGAARVKKVHVSPGDLVELGQVLVELEFTQAQTQATQAN
jgi:biotin carboxyl carrier protein